MDFTLLRPGKVWAALEGHPDRPGLRTVERWCAGAPVPQWAVDAMRALLTGREETAPPLWTERLEAQMNSVTTKLDAFDEWHRRADEREQGRTVEAATQGAVEAVRVFLAENGIRLATGAVPEPEPIPEDPQPR